MIEIENAGIAVVDAGSMNGEPTGYDQNKIDRYGPPVGGTKVICKFTNSHI